MGEVVTFPYGIPRGARPDSLNVVWTPDGWTIQFAHRRRHYGSRYFGLRSAAQAEAERLVAKYGLAWPGRRAWLESGAPPPGAA